MSILFITSNRIGDAVLSTGLLNRLLEMYPDDDVVVAAGGPCTALFEAVPRLTALHPMTKKARGGHWIELWRKVSGRRWRAVCDVRRSAMPWVIRARDRYIVPKARDDEHRVLSLSRTFGSGALSPKLWTHDYHEQAADRLIGDNDNFIVMAPTANWIGKTWPADRFADLAEQLTGCSDRAVVIVGAEHEREMTREIFDRLGERAIDGIGIGLLESYAVINRASLFVGNDSGLMHLAAATGTPTVGLFGPSEDKHYAPWGEQGLVVRTPETPQEHVSRPGYDFRNADCMMVNLKVATVDAAIRDRWPELF